MSSVVKDGSSRFVPDGARVDRRAISPRVNALMRANNWRAALEITWQWTMISAIICGVWYFDSPPAYLAGMLLVATRQHALIIVLHDSIHRCLFTNKFANEYVADLLLGIPTNLMVRGLRAHHLAHHRHFGTETDPDRRANEMLPQVAGQLLHRRASTYAIYFFRRAWMYLTIGTVISLLLPQRDPESAYSPKERVALLAWVGLWLGIITWFGLWFDFIVLWIVPYVAILPVAIFIRGRAEHDIEYTEEVKVARFVNAGPLGRFFISPNFIQYHSQHHLYPAVPSFNLPKLQAILMEDPVYREHAIITPGYVAWFKELLARRRQAAGIDNAPAPEGHSVESAASVI